MTQPVTGADLVAWGHRPGPAFRDLLNRANAALSEGQDRDAVRALLDTLKQPGPLALFAQGALPLHSNIRAETEDEAANVAAVGASMVALLRTPTLVAGAVLPDACPAGPLGTIPVGGVAAAKNAIHPGMHSADICCSVMLTDFGAADPAAVLDAATAVTHFGTGGRPEGARMAVAPALLDAFRANSFLSGPRLLAAAVAHMGTQGDGNHFLFVGRSRATGRTAMVTHHGSRGPGAALFKAGMEVAERFRRELSPATLKQNGWIPADTAEGRAYWQALRLIRDWTKANHTVLHDGVAARLGAEVQDRFWNEHNFVFERDGLFLHGKGATPAWAGHAADSNGLALIPLNMAEPVLVVRGSDAPGGLGFAPHGAGRNFSRGAHRQRLGEVAPLAQVARETGGLDIRFHAGAPDVSELPSAYKDAKAVMRQIDDYGLAQVVDCIDPFGCIMAGDLPKPWLRR